MNWPFFLPPPLRRPLALAAAALAPAFALAYAAHNAQQQALAARNEAVLRVGQMEAKLQHLRSAREDIGHQADLFLRLQAAGIVGEARPTAWVALLHKTQQDMGLPALQYELLPPPAGNGDSGFGFHATAMGIRLQLLHEGDLLDFLGRLQREARALVLVRRCQVTRLPASASPPQEPGTPRLQANCDLDWATAYRREEERI